MIPPERLSARTVSIQPSRRRAPERNAEVRSNSDDDRDDPCSKRRSGPEIRTGIGVRAPRTLPPHLCATLQTICRPFKSHT
jgi:hypothetical protein